MALKLAARRLSSSSPPPSMRCGEVPGLGDVLGRLGQPPHGRERGSGDEQAERGGERDAAGRDQEQDQRSRWSV